MPSKFMLSIVYVALSIQFVKSEFVASFDHGVASGDPLPESVIIWTKVTPRSGGLQFIYVDWRVSLSSQSLTNMTNLPFANGSARADRDSDFTVKVDVKNLQAGQVYFYAFYAGAARSPVGRFKVPHRGDQKVDKLKFAVFSCSNWGWGYFNAYDAASHMDLDFWLHLGDFIYDYGAEDTYPSPVQAVRYAPAPLGLQPPNELITLADYRQRYALYRRDEGLQALSASAALIAVWDAHELANEQQDDVDDHQTSSEGSVDQRKAAAVRAFHEWMPTRNTRDSSEGAGREFYFGDLASLLMLETRAINRSAAGLKPQDDAAVVANPSLPSASATSVSQVSSIAAQLSPSLWDQNVTDRIGYVKNRLDAYRWKDDTTIVGQQQVAWIEERTKSSKANGTKWQLIGQQRVVFDMRMDIDSAIANKRTSGDMNTTSRWSEHLHNVTGWDCATPLSCADQGGHQATYHSYDPTPYKRHLLGKDLDVTPSLVVAARTAYAISKFSIPSVMDSWEGHASERLRFLSALSPAKGSAVVYGGGAHNAWAGVHEEEDGGPAVCAEYDTTSVSSTGKENAAYFFPPDLVASSLIAGISNVSEGGKFVGRLHYADAESRGFILVQLTREAHEGKFMYVDTCCRHVAAQRALMSCDIPQSDTRLTWQVGSKQYAINKCSAVHYVPRGKSFLMLGKECGAVDAGEPYRSSGLLDASLCGCLPGECKHGCARRSVPPQTSYTGLAGGVGWFEQAQEDIEKQMREIADSLSDEGWKLAGLVSGMVLLLCAAVVVLYRRAFRSGSRQGVRYAPQTDHEMMDLMEEVEGPISPSYAGRFRN